MRAWTRERAGHPDNPRFATSTGRKLTRDALERRLTKHATTTAAACPSRYALAQMVWLAIGLGEEGPTAVIPRSPALLFLAWVVGRTSERAARSRQLLEQVLEATTDSIYPPSGSGIEARSERLHRRAVEAHPRRLHDRS